MNARILVARAIVSRAFRKLIQLIIMIFVLRLPLSLDCGYDLRFSLFAAVEMNLDPKEHNKLDERKKKKEKKRKGRKETEMQQLPRVGVFGYGMGETTTVFGRNTV